MKQLNRTFQLSGGGLSSPVVLADKANCVVDGMGTRIFNHDGTVCFSSAKSVEVLELSSTEVEVADPVVETPAEEQASAE